ncbi:hypothetical protein [Prosthecobacter vanneervenii]|uniref:Uncharacterized protein n=1 Tax=Prosthecobacter vanneervenii TaxID=48466 RepID=A0A7W7YB87_9BACT|nr:hypothetical protein [Prosthecobacter vanneervenii]MBB5032920.1 hypothetical protein [Prosthecobacter vanneervenii]
MNLILIVDTVQFYRDVFRSRLLEELLADESSRITLYCTFNLEATQKEFEHERVRIVALKRKKPTWFSSFLFSWAKDLWTVEQPESSFTQKRMIEALANKRKNLHFRLGIARMAMQMGITSQGIIRFMEHFGHDADFEKLIREVKPDAVVFANMIPSDLECLKEARRHKIPLILAVASWDNPTSKGPLTVIPDYTLVWSTEMTQEMAQCHGMPQDSMSVVGVIYFENYFSPEKLMTREEFCKQLGVAPETKIIQFATGDSAVIRCNQPFVRLLQRIIAEQPFEHPCHLLVRVSPKDIYTLYKEFEGLPHTTVQYPLGEGSAFGRHSWIPQADEDYERASTLKNTDVLLTSGSSIILDAACFDIPVVNLAYDCDLDLPPWLSVVRFFKYVHAQPVLQEDATWMVHNDEQLRTALAECVSHPEKRRKERRALLERAVTHTDGQTCRRWREAVAGYLAKGAPRR